MEIIKRREEPSHSSPIKFLSKDLIMNILSRLPAKSLVRSKSVSKSWLSLFTDPYFAKMHLRRSHKHKKLFSWSEVIFSGNIDERSTIHDVDFTLQFDSAESVKFVGSCDGLILCLVFPFGGEHELHLVNPSTREVNRLHLPFESRERDSYGFGYDASTDDYKVVHISNSDDRSTCMTSLYTLKTDSWRRIEDIPHNVRCFATLLNGALHWLSEDTSKIVSFDLAEEKFRDFLLPDFKTQCEAYLVVVLRGCLCVCVTRLDHITFFSEFWVMKEYGKRESWTKLGFTIPRYQAKPLDFSKKDQILYVVNPLLLVFDLEKNTHSYLEIPYYTVDNQLRGLQQFDDAETTQFDDAETCFIEFGDADTFLESIVSPLGNVKDRKKAGTRDEMTDSHKVNF